MSNRIRAYKVTLEVVPDNLEKFQPENTETGMQITLPGILEVLSWLVKYKTELVKMEAVYEE